MKDNSNHPLISVIIPVYNVQEYLNDCVEKITSQTYTNLDIILVDDGSTDSSGKMCDEFAQHDNRIKVIHKENGGLSDARNYGIKEAKGKYIAFVDSDDTVDIKFIEVLYSLISSGDYQLSQVGVQFVDDQNNKMPQTFSFENGVSALDKRQFIKGLLTNEITWAAWCNLYKKEFFDEIKFTKDQYNEDCLMWISGVEKLSHVIISDKLLYMYRQRSGSITSGANLQFYTDQLKHAKSWVIKIKEDYPQLMDAAYNEFLSDLLIYLRAQGVKKSNSKYIDFCRKHKNLILSNKYLPLKRKVMLLGIALMPNISIEILHKIFIKKNRD